MAERRRLTAAGALTLVERVLRGGHNVFFELLDQAVFHVEHVRTGNRHPSPTSR